MENLCKLFKETNYLFKTLQVCHCDDSCFDLEQLGQKYNLSLCYRDKILQKSKSYGPDLYVRKVDDRLIAFGHPGKATKLPAGLDKIKGAKTFDEIFKRTCSLDSNWRQLENEIGKGINIWTKESLGLNKNRVKGVRNSKKRPALNFHFDCNFEKLFLITCTKTYFRGNLRKIKHK